MPYCEQCGKKIREVAKFCRECGEKVKVIKEESKKVRGEKKKARRHEKGRRRKEEEKEREKIKSFKLATVGSMITTAGSILLGIFFIIFNDPDLDKTTLRNLLGISSFLLAIGLILTETWFYELAGRFRNKLGKPSFIIAFTGAVFWFILTFIALYLDIIDLGTVFIVTLILSSIFTGVLLILQGIILKDIRGNLTSQNITKVQPPISMLAGICFMSIILVIYFGIALFLMAVANILLGVLFLKEK